MLGPLLFIPYINGMTAASDLLFLILYAGDTSMFYGGHV